MTPTTTSGFVLPVRLGFRAVSRVVSFRRRSGREYPQVPMTSDPSLGRERPRLSVLAGSRSGAVWIHRLAQLLLAGLVFLGSETVSAVCESRPGLGPEMVYLPGGTFMMGSAQDEPGRDENEGPQHPVWIAPFALMRCEVTRGEFKAFIEETGYRTSAEDKGCFTETSPGEGNWEQRSGRDWRNGLAEQTDTHPVICVSWDDAQAYARWLSRKTGATYRLPSEAEFEYALHAGKTTAYPWSSEENQCQYANGADQKAKERYSGAEVAECNDGYVWTAPVGQFITNGLGLYDLSGNVWEWVTDCWHPNYQDAPEDGRSWGGENAGDCSRRVLRGGGWSNPPQNLRSAFRTGASPMSPASTSGFVLPGFGDFELCPLILCKSAA